MRIGEDLTCRVAHRATAAHYGMVEWVDQQYGRGIAKLDELGLRDDFVVAPRWSSTTT